jgi:hypothetical protein
MIFNSSIAISCGRVVAKAFIHVSGRGVLLVQMSETSLATKDLKRSSQMNAGGSSRKYCFILWWLVWDVIYMVERT